VPWERGVVGRMADNSAWGCRSLKKEMGERGTTSPVVPAGGPGGVKKEIGRYLGIRRGNGGGKTRRNKKGHQLFVPPMGGG